MRPQWILDCVAQGRLVPTADYLLDEFKTQAVGGLQRLFSPRVAVYKHGASTSGPSSFRTPTNLSRGCVEGPVSAPTPDNPDNPGTCGTGPKFFCG